MPLSRVELPDFPEPHITAEFAHIPLMKLGDPFT